MPPESKLIESTDNLESTVSSLTQKLDELNPCSDGLSRKMSPNWYKNSIT